jgi:hypothetical protein
MANRREKLFALHNKSYFAILRRLNILTAQKAYFFTLPELIFTYVAT